MFGESIGETSITNDFMLLGSIIFSLISVKVSD